MRFALRQAGLTVLVLFLSGCDVLIGTASSSSGALASVAAGGVSAYRQVQSQVTGRSNQTNPYRQPSRIPEHEDYDFKNAIAFFPRDAGTYVTSSFGWRTVGGRADFHCGVDVVAPVHTPVLAVVGGWVTLDRSAGADGGVVIYSNGRQYTYWHAVPQRGLRVGQWVRRGQTIATLAPWGDRTHLHYGIHLTGANASPDARKTTNCVDPIALAHRGLF